MIEQVKETYNALLEDEDFQHLPKEKLMDYAVQIVVAVNVKKALHGIESSIDYK